MPDSEGSLPDLPTSFIEEIKQVFGDVHEDYARTILETSSETLEFFRGYVMTLMTSGRTPAELVDDFGTAFIWMILLGREHHAQGFSAPVARSDDYVDELISDDSIARLMDGDQ